MTRNYSKQRHAPVIQIASGKHADAAQQSIAHMSELSIMGAAKGPQNPKKKRPPQKPWAGQQTRGQRSSPQRMVEKQPSTAAIASGIGIVGVSGKPPAADNLSHTASTGGVHILGTGGQGSGKRSRVDEPEPREPKRRSLFGYHMERTVQQGTAKEPAGAKAKKAATAPSTPTVLAPAKPAKGRRGRRRLSDPTIAPPQADINARLSFSTKPPVPQLPVATAVPLSVLGLTGPGLGIKVQKRASSTRPGANTRKPGAVKRPRAAGGVDRQDNRKLADPEPSPTAAEPVPKPDLIPSLPATSLVPVAAQKVPASALATVQKETAGPKKATPTNARIVLTAEQKEALRRPLYPLRNQAHELNSMVDFDETDDDI